MKILLENEGFLLMNITLLCIGKLKEKYLKEALADYAKRISYYCKFEIVEIPDEKSPENAGEAIEKQIKDKEGQNLLKNLKEDTYLIALTPDGNMESSEKFSARIARLGVMGRSNIAFAIGGSLGLSEDVLKRADYKMSFSELTFPHGLFRVMLLEQIYRAFKIERNETYHK